jgi:hypothetical protein
MRVNALGFAAAVLAVASVGHAQQPYPPAGASAVPQQVAPPGYPAPPPPGTNPYAPGAQPYPPGANPYAPGATSYPYPYTYPPPQGAPPPPYAYPQPTAYSTPAPAPTRPWRSGDPVPTGYHVEDKPRSGILTAGYVLTGIPYGIGLLSATAANFKNSSAWLAVPWLGPWLTIGQRGYACGNEGRGVSQSLECAGEVFLVMGLIMDGILQATGATLLIVGYTNTKEVLVPDQQAVRLVPLRFSSGFGAGLTGAF